MKCGWRCALAVAILAVTVLGFGTNLQHPAGLPATELKWEEAQSAPVSGGYGQGLVGAGDSIYLVKCLNAFSVPEAYRYDPAEDRWSTVSTEGLPLGAFRNGTALAWDGQTTIYALGGARYADTDRREVWQYDIRSERWARLPDTPYDQGAGNAITWSGYDEQIYAFVGSRHSNHNRGRSYFVRYDPHEATWTTLPLNWAATDDGASLAWAGEYIYALGGGGRRD